MLGVIGNKFSIGKETYDPFSAEIHYFRIDKRYWSICFERIKRAGFRIISTAVPWNIHVDSKKFVDFAGDTDPRKDLIVFLELAREFGFKVILRPGPWVAGQLPNGGLPSFLFRDLKVFARDASGQETKLPDDHGVTGGYLPSYLHKNYQFHLRSYFKAFIERTKNYVHPRGPVFMVELDYETSFGRLLEPTSADYNPDVLAEHYPVFLRERYEDIKKLNAAYREKHEDFATVEPPRKFVDLEQRDYVKALDWFRFREYVLNTYLKILEDYFKAYTVEPLIARSLYFRSGDVLPAYNLVPDEVFPFLGVNVFPGGTYFDLAAKARFLRSEYGFAWAASFQSGSAAVDARREAEMAPITNETRRFYLAASLASGFKGLNHYMFVDREHWYGAPLNNDGTVSPGYNVTSRFNQAIMTLGFEDMESKPDIAVLGNRLYSWMRLLDSKKAFPYMPLLVDETAPGLCRDLLRLKLDFGIRENRDWETLKNYKVVVIPSSEVMAERDQEAVVELTKAGVTVVLCGLMPRWDEHQRDCQTLANHFRIKTNLEYHIDQIEHKTGAFSGWVYGSIRSTDDARVKKLCTCGAKTVGVVSSRNKGNLYVFSFDLASGGSHKKLTFLEGTFEAIGLKSYLECSDPSVDMSFQTGSKKSLLIVVAPPPGELSDVFQSERKEVIIKADLKALGFKGIKARLTDILDDEDAKPIKTTAKELKQGIPVTLSFPGGHVFVVDKRT